MSQPTPRAERIARIKHAESRGYQRCAPYADIGVNQPRWFYNGGYYDYSQLPLMLTYSTLAAMPLLDRTRAFIDWLKAQPADATYLPGSFTGCALAQFGATVGCPRGGSYNIGSPRDWLEIIHYDVDVVRWTCRARDGTEGNPTSFHAFAAHLEQSLATLTP